VRNADVKLSDSSQQTVPANNLVYTFASSFRLLARDDLKFTTSILIKCK